MKDTKKKIPQFKNEEEEQRFWQEHDSSEYVDWSKAQKTRFPELKPSVRTISLRLPESMLDELKILANKWDVPYQSLMKMFLAERLDEELHGKTPAASAMLSERRATYNKRTPKKK